MERTPRVKGILETALHVSDMKRSMEFYQSLFGFEPMQFNERFCAFAVPGPQVLLLFLKDGSREPVNMPEGTIPPHDGAGRLHFAFSIAEADLQSWEEWLKEKGVGIESKVKWEEGGTSIYFRDPDEHLVELATPGCWPNY